MSEDPKNAVDEPLNDEEEALFKMQLGIPRDGEFQKLGFDWDPTGKRFKVPRLCDGKNPGQCPAIRGGTRGSHFFGAGGKFEQKWHQLKLTLLNMKNQTLTSSCLPFFFSLLFCPFPCAFSLLLSSVLSFLHCCLLCDLWGSVLKDLQGKGKTLLQDHSGYVVYS